MGTYILIALILNAMFVIGFWCYYLGVSKSKETDITKPKEPQKPPEIIGECHQERRHSTPQAATSSDLVSTKEKDDTFAPETKKQHVAQIPSEELNKAFENSEPPIPEADIEIEYKSEIDIENEYEDVVGNTHEKVEFASGSDYEAICDAVTTVQKENSPIIEQIEAGETFYEMEGNDMYCKLMSGSEKIAGRISEMVSLYLTKVVSKTVASSLKPITNIADFNINDFV